MDDLTRAPGTCPNCGKPLPPDAPEGLCAACLLTAGTETLTGGGDETPTILPGWGDSASGGPDGQRLAPGETWGPYRIGRLLGRGGMGEVYEAEHVDSGRRIALKVLRSRLQNRDERARFLREGQLAASISHPHTVYIFGSEEVAGMPVISMELLPGGTLKDRVVAGGPLPVAEAVSAVLDIVGGLDAAQSAGILHRDIKPSNCFVDHDGSVKVGDFGLSISTLARDVRGVLGTDSGFQGTPQFAPPEQLRGEPIDVRADIYAVGATLYYLLTGHTPFDAPDLQELFARVTNEIPKSPRAHRSDIPAKLAAIVLQCLEKAPARRPASYAELAELLRPFSRPNDRPAAPGIRFMAGVVDSLLLAFVVLVWRGATLNLAAPEQSQAWTWLFNLAYFLCLEPLWGASLGKRLFGLRVVSVTGQHAPMATAFRTLIYYVPNLLVVLLLIVYPTIPTGIEVRRTPVASSGWSWNSSGSGDVRSGLTFLFSAVLFLSMRRRNGWAALHDLATGTRVVARTVATVRHAADHHEPAAAPVPQLRERRFGPFTAVSELGTTADGQLLVGFDPILRRPVWIHVVSPQMPPITPERRDVNRIGRLHWLTGHRSPDANWDAFEAPAGAPLLAAHRISASPVRTTSQWSVLKVWLLDLVNELAAAERDRTTPPLALDRIWIRNDGRMILVDFPVVAANSSSRAERAYGLTPVGLLTAVAAHVRSRSEDTVPQLPLSARSLLDSWTGPDSPTLEAARSALVHVATIPDTITRGRRAVPIGVAAVPIVMMTVLGLLLAPLLNRFLTSEDTQVLRWLEALNDKTPPEGSRINDPAVHDAVERYVAGRYGALIRDPDYWNQMITRGMGEQRVMADSILARHPSVSAEELAAVTIDIAPELERFNRSRQNDVSQASSASAIVIGAVTVIGLCFSMVLSLLSALIVPGGLLTRLTGLAVVRRDGTEIGRSRSLGRALLMWLPGLVWIAWLATAPRVQGWVPAPPAPLPRVALVLSVFAVGSIWTLARPSRGPHDRIAGTWVVPR